MTCWQSSASRERRREAFPAQLEPPAPRGQGSRGLALRADRERVGALDVHHRRGREFNDDADLEVLTRREHIEHHRAERLEKLPPAVKAWRALIASRMDHAPRGQRL